MYLKQILFSSIILFLPLKAEVFEGYTLFTPYLSSGTMTYLMDNQQNFINSWSHSLGPASMSYLLPDSSIVYPFRVENPTMEAGGVGGGIHHLNWQGDLLWEFILSDYDYQHHHDIEPLPNGNILIIAWERKTAEEAYAMGREEINNPLGQMWSEAILELDPASGDIVWEWHLWDHLIQDVDSTLFNYGVISEHPELFDINIGSVGNNLGGPQGANGDWMHFNAVNYNQVLDQIVISSRLQNEIFVFDHSTTTEEAAGHIGGNSGKGGDFLYRWGNPENYDRGDESDSILGDQHGVNWIPPGYPGEGNLILFNNFHVNNNSAVLEIITPIDGEIYIIEDGEPYGPETWEWIYTGDITTPMQGGAFRLPNGNTLITQTHTSKIIEVDLEGNELWEYNFEPDIGSSWIARAQKYGLDYFTGYLQGDVNGDGEVNILDVVTLVNLILFGGDYESAADLNQDNFLDILDVISLINIILAD